MRIPVLSAVALALACTACAAPIGTAAGDVVGGLGWAAIKSSKVMVKGGKYAVRTTGRGITLAGKAVTGAADGVRDGISPPADKNRIGQLSQGQGTTLTH